MVTATRFAEPPQDIPVGVTVITDEQIQRSGVTSLPQLLSRQPGITVRDASGNPDQQVDIRGFGITGDQNTLVMVDGQRLSENELTGARWSTIPLSAIDHIEILRSSGAVLYGSGASGGVINIITKTPQSGQRGFNVYAGYGTYDTLDLRAGGTIAGERLGFTINAGDYSSDNYRDHNRVQQRNLEAAVQTVGPGPVLAFRFGLDDQELQLPGARTAAQLQTDPRGATTANDFANRTGGHALLTGRFDLGFGELATDFGYRKKDADSSVFFFGNRFQTSTNVDTWSLSPRLKIPHHWIGTEDTLIVGVDLDYWDYDATRDFGPAHVSATQSDLAVYLQYSMQFSTGTVVSLGGRLQETYVKARDEDSDAPYARGEQTQRPTAYELAVRQNLRASLTGYGKIGQSFRTGNVDEIYNQFGGPFFDPIVTFLEPQTTQYAEVGLELNRESVYLRASLYYMNLENEIHFDPGTFTNVNLPPTRRYGAELEGRWKIRPWLEVGGNYTFAVSQFRSGQFDGEDVAGKTVPLVPRNKFNLSGSIDFSANTRLGAVYSYVGTQFFDGDETNSFGQKIPAYRLLDLKLSHQIGNWTLAALATNLLNEPYFNYGLVIGPTFIAYPQAGQAVFFTAEYRTR